MSCSDVGNISIMEKLPIVELNKMIESDSIYSFSTERVKALNQFATTLDSAKYYKITHKSFSDFLLKEDEIEADIDLKNEFLNKWENEYGKYKNKFKEVSFNADISVNRLTDILIKIKN